MNDEIKSLGDNETWTLVQLPVNNYVIRNGWVFKIKYNLDSNINQFKARLVIKGCSQKYGIYYTETFFQ